MTSLKNNLWCVAMATFDVGVHPWGVLFLSDIDTQCGVVDIIFLTVYQELHASPYYASLTVLIAPASFDVFLATSTAFLQAVYTFLFVAIEGAIIATWILCHAPRIY